MDGFVIIQYMRAVELWPLDMVLMLLKRINPTHSLIYTSKVDGLQTRLGEHTKLILPKVARNYRLDLLFYQTFPMPTSSP